jgi:D-glycero-alpha-D-manno-heptose 1-phosphate guanylyltransferase
MNFSERYGSVKIDENNRIIDFSEKAQKFNILINGGIYLLNKKFFLLVSYTR